MENEVRRLIFLRYESFRDYLRLYPVTSAILAVNLLAFIADLLLPGNPLLDADFDSDPDFLDSLRHQARLGAIRSGFSAIEPSFDNRRPTALTRRQEIKNMEARGRTG